MQKAAARIGIALFVVAGAVFAGAMAPRAQRAAGAPLNFLACPIVRDTATLPCWLAEHDGELYYLGSQGSTSSAFYPPQLLHDVLVEAVVGDGPRVCGGLPLRAVEVSVMPEINRACNTILPAEPGHSAPPSPPAPAPSYPDTTREFRVAYDFDSDYLTLHTTRVLLEVVRIARIAKPTRIEVAGLRGATALSDGRVLTERPGMGDERAKKVRDILIGLGLAEAAIQVSATAEAGPALPANTVAPRHVSIVLH